MHPRPAGARGRRVAAVALVIGVHALFLLLLLAGNHIAPRERTPPDEPEGVWIHLLPLPPPPPPADVRRPVPDEAAPPPPAPSRDERLPRPATAITLPTSPQAPEPVEESTPPPQVDWQAEAARIARRLAEESAADTGETPGAMREPCKPQVSSLWGKPKEEKPDEPPSWQDMVPPNAHVLTGVSRHTIKGGFGIPIGKPKPRDDLFDDMLAGKTPRSSVPHPNTCD